MPHGWVTSGTATGYCCCLLESSVDEVMMSIRIRVSYGWRKAIGWANGIFVFRRLLFPATSEFYLAWSRTVCRLFAQKNRFANWFAYRKIYLQPSHTQDHLVTSSLCQPRAIRDQSVVLLVKHRCFLTEMNSDRIPFAFIALVRCRSSLPKRSFSWFMATWR